MLDRIIGVVMLKAPVYREIADDQTATSQAAIIVIIATLVRGFFQGLVTTSSSGTTQISVVGAIVGAIVTVIVGLIGWVFSAWVLAFVAQRMEGKTDTSEMMRVTGFVQVFGLVAVLNILVAISPILGCITGLIGLAVGILSLIGYLIGVREAAEFTTGKAVVAAIIAAIVNFIIIAVIGGAILAAVMGAMALTR